MQFDVTSGIRQVCNASASVFLLITHIIIFHLNQAQSDFRDEICFILALFYANDGLLLAQSKEEAQNLNTILITACGHEIN